MRRVAGIAVVVGLFLCQPATAARPGTLTWGGAKHAIAVYATGDRYTARCARRSAITVTCIVRYDNVGGLFTGETGWYEDRQRVGLRHGQVWVFSEWTRAQRIR